MRNILLAAAIVAVAPLPAVAAATQTAAAVGLREADDDRAMVQPFDRTVDQIEDMNVYGTAGEKIGEVDEVLIDTSGNVVAVSVESGGFLGIGDEEVVVMLDQLTLDGDRFSTRLTKEQLLALPRWQD